jgi:hypothetical protein
MRIIGFMFFAQLKCERLSSLARVIEGAKELQHFILKQGQSFSDREVMDLRRLLVSPWRGGDFLQPRAAPQCFASASTNRASSRVGFMVLLKALHVLVSFQAGARIRRCLRN